MGVDVPTLWNQMKDIIVKTFICVEAQVNGAANMRLFHQSNCFQLFGFDILIDENQRPWVLEVNFSPSLGTESLLDMEIKSSLISDIFTLIGVQPYDEEKMRDYRAHRRATVGKGKGKGKVGGEGKGRDGRVLPRGGETKEKKMKTKRKKEREEEEREKQRNAEREGKEDGDQTSALRSSTSHSPSSSPPSHLPLSPSSHNSPSRPDSPNPILPGFISETRALSDPSITPSDMKIIRSTNDELLRSRLGSYPFERIFPTELSFRYRGFFEKERSANVLLAHRIASDRVEAEMRGKKMPKYKGRPPSASQYRRAASASGAGFSALPCGGMQSDDAGAEAKPEKRQDEQGKREALVTTRKMAGNDGRRWKGDRTEQHRKGGSPSGSSAAPRERNGLPGRDQKGAGKLKREVSRLDSIMSQEKRRKGFRQKAFHYIY